MFFEQLQKICKEKGTSPSAVAVEIGKSKSAVTRWKNGQEPNLGDALKIALVLKCEVTDLISTENIKEKLVSYYDGFKDGAAAIYKMDSHEVENQTTKKPVTISDDELYKIDNIIPFTPGKRIPIYGCVPAGAPAFADECIEGYDYADVSDPENYIFLRVKGDSMINANIFNGDLVLVQKQNTAENGQIVVCLVNGDEATLKRFRRGSDAILLIPENPEFQPIIVRNKDFEDGYAKILGVAREIKRKL